MMELNTYRLNSLEEPTDAQLHALMEQVAMSARESSRHAELELKHRRISRVGSVPIAVIIKNIF